jgi:hypothetical protein
MSPHIQKKQQFAVGTCLFYCFYQRCARALPSEPPPFIHCVEYTTSPAATADIPLGTEHTHVVPVKAPLLLWWQPAHHHKMSHSPVCLQNSTKLRACWLKKGFVCLYLLVFYSCVFICGDSCQLWISAFYSWNPQHPPMWTKATISLENREKLRVLNQPAELRQPFYFTNMIAAILMCPSISHNFLLTIFHQDILFTSQTETLNLFGPEWSVSDFGFRGVHVFITLKSGEEVKVMLPSQSMRMPWRHNNQPVIAIVCNIENINWI